MLTAISRYIGFARAGTSFTREIVAGITTFVTMSYIIVVNPAILKTANIPVEASMIATIVTAIVGTLLMIRRFPAAILVGLLATAFLAFATGVAAPPKAWVGLPPSLSSILFKLDFHIALTWGFFPVVLTIFIMAFVDTMGTLIGVSAR